MVRKKDSLWAHAEELANKFKCKYCERVFSGGLTRLKYHLSGQKGHDVDTCAQVPDDVQALAYLSILNKKRKLEGSEANMEESVGGTGTTSSPSVTNTGGGGMFSQTGSMGRKGIHQSTMPQMAKKLDKSEVDKMLAKFFIQNNIAFNVVQQKTFIDLVKGIAEVDPSYKLPSYSTLRTKLIPQAKNEVDEYVENVKKSWERTGCTIMSDTWSDIRQRCFINFIAYSPGGAVFLQSVEISQERKTGIFLKELSSRVIDMVGPQNVVQFISDNASNFESAGDMLVGKYPTMYKTKCVAHGVQLLLKDIYEQVPWLKNIVDCAKSIQLYMYRHTIVTALMRKATNGKELKKPCATRFASNFLVLQSILDVENELRLFVASPEWRELSYTKSRDAKSVTEIIQMSSFWSQGKEVIMLLEPLVRILRLVDGDGSTAGYLYQAMEMARDTLRKKKEQDEEKYGHVLTLFEKRRDGNIIHPVHAVAAFLNPSYMVSPDFKETWEMKQDIFYLFENVVHVDERDQFMKESRNYRMKLPEMVNSATLSMLKTYHPRLWWEFCGDPLPVLQKYAIRILSQPCSSSSCERNWSAFEAAQTKKRNRLTPNMLGLLVYCRMTTMMMDKFHDKVLKDADPFDLTNLTEWPDYGEEVEPCPPAPLDEGGEVLPESPQESSTSSLTSVCVTFVDEDDNDAFDPLCSLDFHV